MNMVAGARARRYRVMHELSLEDRVFGVGQGNIQWREDSLSSLGMMVNCGGYIYTNCND